MGQHSNRDILKKHSFSAYADNVLIHHLSVGGADDFDIMMNFNRRISLTSLIASIVIPTCIFAISLIFTIIRIIVCVRRISMQRRNAIRERQRALERRNPNPMVRVNIPRMGGVGNNGSAVGLSRFQQQFKEIVYSKEIDAFNEPVCTICMGSLDTQEKVILLKCKHLFHSACIISWVTNKAHNFNESVKCPNCNLEMISK